MKLPQEKETNLDVAAVMNSCNDKAQREGIENLSELEQTIALVNTANFEIELGGLDAFYYNSAGERAVETVAALEKIGANDAAAYLRRSNALFPEGLPAKDREERFEQLEKIRADTSEPLNAITTAIYKLDPDMFSTLSRFIEMNAAQLREHC